MGGLSESYNVRTKSNNTCEDDDYTADVRLISLAGVDNTEQRSILVEEIARACSQQGVFQIIDHGISKEVLKAALSAATCFFMLPDQDKDKFKSDDVYKPVRYGASWKDGVDRCHFRRVFLKHYAHPLSRWMESWPDSPPYYRKNMGEYAVAVHKLAQTITGLITESLGLTKTYLASKLDVGMQVIAVNSYPPPPPYSKLNPESARAAALGLPPHSDYGCLTVVLQGSPGLQVRDLGDGSWRTVPVIDTALQVHVGDQLEVLSNGRYKSIVHRVIADEEMTRVSIAALHCLDMDEKMAAAEELVDEDCPIGYRESCFRDFLDFISRNDIGEGASFLNFIRIPK